MADLAHLTRAFSHDPVRRSDRSPSGAVPAGTDVVLTLRVAPEAREHVLEALLVVEGDDDAVDETLPMEPCAEGYRACIDTSCDPRVLFYRFVVNTDAGEVVTPAFQLTVYDPGFTVPEWYTGSVMYQAFPDRFARGSEGIRREGVDSHLSRGWPVRLHEDWNEPPDWGESYDPVDFFGGTFSGMESKLDYLASLGVEVLYLNPVCEARSNHRYNTGDYQQVDPILGTWEDFERLSEAATARGIRLVLDTVLSHTGSSSKYFNLDGSYDSFGAAQGEGSPYRSWYDFEHGMQYAPYRCWWNDPTLPEVEEHDPSWQQFVFGDEGSAIEAAVPEGWMRGKPKEPRNPLGEAELVRGDDASSETPPVPQPRPDSQQQNGLLAEWVAHGASGFRLDVADELPEDVLEKIRQAAKAALPDSVIIGEVWEDPTTKESYGSRRTYALGTALDTVMNYPLRDKLLQFALGGVDAPQLVAFLKMQKSNYPAPLYHGLMNLLSSHDVERVRSVLDLGVEFRDLPRDEQAALVAGITDEADARGSLLQRILACLVYVLPGVPCLYYGDERGMQGGRDPFDRATFPWDGWRPDCGRDLTGLYQALGKMRSASSVFKRGTAAFYSYGRDVACVLRMPDASMLEEGCPDRERMDGTVLCVANRSNAQVEFVLDLVDASSGLSDEETRALRFARSMPRCVLSTDESGRLPEWEATLEDGIFRGTVGPMQACVFQLDAGLQKPLERGLGVICHVTSVPNGGRGALGPGSGTLGAPAKRFVDMLADCGVKYWQILPLSPTDEYGSPYAGLSAFAGNTRLLEAGTDLDPALAETDEFARFLEANRGWLVPYATFVAIKHEQGGALWRDWPKEYRRWSPQLAELPQLAEGIKAELVKQFAFDVQWRELREHANARGVKIVGDMPIYVSADSADAWMHPEYLSLDARGNLAAQGGMPPDQFSAEGQLWGNPVYDWDALRDDGYGWWLDRFARAFEWYDHVRIDHFLGYESFYSVAAGLAATEGEWLPGPGIDLFRRAYEKFGPLPVLVEDLGIITPQVRQLVAEAGFTGMDVVQFFDGDPLQWWTPKPGKACFTSTHDTQTLVGFAKERYGEEAAERVADELLARVVRSDAPVAFVSLQDVLQLDDDARMNVPGTAGGNWKWQARQSDLNANFDRMKKLAKRR